MSLQQYEMHVFHVYGLQVTKLYEHYMDHTAGNMCYGPFGGDKGDHSDNSGFIDPNPEP